MLLTPRPEIAPDYKSNHELTLEEGWDNAEGIHVQGVRLTLSEHSGGRITAIISKDDGAGSFHALTLSSQATDALRRYLNRAHAERDRSTDRVTVEPV